MTSDRLRSILASAQRRRDADDWEAALLLFKQAEQLAPDAAAIKHNLALVHFARGESGASRGYADQALKLKPSLWQSAALLARIYRAEGSAAAAEKAWQQVLQTDAGNGMALLGLADLAMNEFGDAEAAANLVKPLHSDSAHAADAELTTLMAALYIGDQSASGLSEQLIGFSKRHLRLPPLPGREPRKGRRRIGVMSPHLSNSPVYHLTHSSLEAIAGAHDLIFFNRGIRRDEGTSAFRELGHEWHEVAATEPAALARNLAGADLDILLDLGGWSDVPALLALSAKPAARMYKWVGGQAATTGLEMFDGWVGDEWQSPVTSSSLYAEPLINIEGGYVDYTVPPSFNRHAARSKRGIALVGNPVKVGRKTIAAWPDGVEKVRLIDRRYRHKRARERVMELMSEARICVEAVVTPKGHDEYLKELASCEAIVNTQPYSAGLTAIEAHWLGVKALSGGTAGQLFCSRHHLSHARTGGKNPKLAAQLLALLSK